MNLHRPGHQRSRLPRLSILASALASTALPALAQADGSLPASAPAVERVVVTGTRVGTLPFDVPASVVRVDAADISNDRPRINLSESLGAVPGLVARDRQNYAQDAQISVRGFGARSSFGIRGVRLYVDGIPATLPDGQGQISHVDLGSADHIEVLRGPFSALYGNSSGGMVQVFTQEGSGPPAVQGSLVHGSNDTWRESLKASGASGAFGYVLNASQFQTAGSREHAAARRNLGNAKLTWRPDGEQSFQLVANSVDLPVAQDPLGLTRAQFDANPKGVAPVALSFDTRKTMNQTQLGLTWERRLGATQALSVMVYGGHRGTEQFQAIPVASQNNPLHPGGVIKLARDYSGSDLHWTWKPRGDESLSLIAGLAADQLDEHRQGYQNFVGTRLGVEGALRRDEDNRATSVDPYLQLSWRPTARWRIDAGVRETTVRIRSTDHYIVGSNGDDSGATRFRASSPALSAMFSASESLNLYASSGRGFETPTLNELAYRPDGSAGLNFSLKPAHSDNVEVGAKWRLADRQSLDLALFETNTRDEIVTRTNVAGRATYQNAARTRRSGTELGWRATPATDWRLQASLTWLNASYRDGFSTCNSSPCTTPQPIPAGQRMPGVAKATAYASLDWTPPQGWQAGFEARASGAVSVDDRGSDYAPRYAIASAHAGYLASLRGITLHGFVRIDNLFDRRYAGSVIVNESSGRYFEPAPGRTAIVGVDASVRF